MGTDGGENSFTLEGKVNNPNAAGCLAWPWDVYSAGPFKELSKAM